MSNILKNAGGLPESSVQTPFDRQKVNFVALQSFHQQWMATHTAHHNASPQMPQRGFAGSSTNVGLTNNMKGV